MFASQEYQLLDFGSGRKLERFGPYVLDRPSPAAASARRQTDSWEQADARYERAAGQRGKWVFRRALSAAWPIQFGPMNLGLRFTDSGQVGLFPEQAGNWDWIAEQICAAPGPTKVLNLFGYTGGSTLAAAAAGAEVTHVDSAGNVVAWARRNVAASHMEGAPIRWITEDAIKYARRELKRGQRYNAVILDPPGYGHGPQGEPWKLGEQLGDLLDVCWKLTAGNRLFLLLTCHSGELAAAAGLLKAVITEAPQLRREGKVAASDMLTVSASGGRLHCGATARWCSANEPTSGRTARAAHSPARQP